MPEMRLHITESEMININIENANDDTTIPLQPSGSDNTTPKDIKKKKTVDKSVKKIYVDTTIPGDKQANIKNIFVYDVPSSWSHKKFLPN
ncbi:hypothetical protein RclHR1_09200002 [Rhizophagus clarus]|uniref:Uncharacterized protein n=1 Tax=Rhizophagus clarus TaxID=94130 RepID=A0A2Z6SPT9_9GLOM|nr:hypothetical protein RclHR1_09200002 [Rhizophagus clarus]